MYKCINCFIDIRIESLYGGNSNHIIVILNLMISSLLPGLIEQTSNCSIWDTTVEFLRVTASEILDQYWVSSKRQKSVIKRAMVCMFCTALKTPSGVSTIAAPVIKVLISRSALKEDAFTDSEFTLDGRFFALFADLLQVCVTNYSNS